MTSVRPEIKPWLSRCFHPEWYGRAIVEKEVADGTTVRDLLEEIASWNRELREVHFDTERDRLAGHIALVLNARFLELSGERNTRPNPGDTMRLMSGFSGG